MKASPSLRPSNTASLHPSTTPPFHPAPPLYALRQGLGFWDLTFAGDHSVFKHELGVSYATYLLFNPPPEPIHALDIATRTASLHIHRAGLSQITDPATGLSMLLDREARLHERSLCLEEAETMRANLRKQKELEALIEDESQIGPVKAEAIRDLEILYAYETAKGPRVRDAAQKAADTVGKAIKRFYQHLNTASDLAGNPNLVLRAFADHLLLHLLIPSGRDGVHGGVRPKRNQGGCFTYQPPPGLVWSSSSPKAPSNGQPTPINGHPFSRHI